MASIKDLALVRDSVRTVIADALRHSPGIEPGADVGRLADELEAEFFKLPPLDYGRRAERAPRVLAHPRGEFLTTSFGADLAAGRATAADVSGAVPGHDLREPGPRTRVRALYHSLLASVPEISGGDAAKFARKLETGCYNQVLTGFENAGLISRWEDPRFLDKYGEHTGRLAANLDPHGSVAKSVGGSPVIRLLGLDRGVPGDIPPELVGALANDALCPQAHTKEKRLISQRLGQKATEKTTNLFECPKCHTFESTYELKQTRALDEPSTIFCRCKKCSHRFQG